MGAVVRARRVELGRTQGDVAASAGVSRQWLSQIEAGKRTAEVGRVLAVFDALDLDLVPVPRERPPMPGTRTAKTAATGVDLDDLLDEYRKR
ncbi:MAG: helix-turn-helix domain-containing protein [Acidimicrobiia bacterium]